MAELISARIAFTSPPSRDLLARIAAAHQALTSADGRLTQRATRRDDGETTAGETLTAIMDDFRRRLGVPCPLLPMSDDAVRTRVRTAAGWIDFQDYFVLQRCAPVVRVLRRRLCATDTRVGASDWILIELGAGTRGKAPLMPLSHSGRAC